MATFVASKSFDLASGQAVQSGLLIVGTPSSQAVRSGLLIVGTLCYFLGGLLCLCGALRRWRVATEAKPVQANTPSPPNAAAQQVASTIESLAVYSAWHAANHRSFMFADAARDLDRAVTPGTPLRLRTLVAFCSELSWVAYSCQAFRVSSASVSCMPESLLNV